MKRRKFLSLLGGFTVWPLPLRAQSSSKPARIGVFAATATNQVMGPAYRAFLDELRRFGFTEGENLLVDHRSSEQHLPTLSEQAVAMARANVDVLVALGAEPALQACLRASRTIPIVFVANNYDPIARGYVQSLARPGGNVTGVFLRQTELAEKQVELLTQALPGRARLAVLWDYISADQFTPAERRAKLLGLEVHSRKMQDPPYELEAAYSSLVDAGVDMLLVLTSPFFALQRDQLVKLATLRRIPTMFIFKDYVQTGGLMSYGADPSAMYRQGGMFVGRILKGTKPNDLPVEQPTKYEFVVNLRTAKAIGIELPTDILLRADQVIE